jgi:hypothetical protein
MKPPAYLALREEAIRRGSEWIKKNAKAMKDLADSHWDPALAMGLYIEAFEAGFAASAGIPQANAEERSDA